jgi:predicted RNase H-like HicB family nuclease
MSLGSEEQFYWADIPDLPEIRADGATRAECEQNLAQAARDRLLLRFARGEELPE